jgi:hypothetical protein
MTIGKQLNLATSTCRRTLSVDGALCEMVRLDGSREGLSDADFEKFVESFPIETVWAGVVFRFAGWPGSFGIGFCRLGGDVQERQLGVAGARRVVA